MSIAEIRRFCRFPHLGRAEADVRGNPGEHQPVVPGAIRNRAFGLQNDCRTGSGWTGALEKSLQMDGSAYGIRTRVTAVRELRQLFDTYVLSTAPWENPTAWSDKLLWVKRHLGPEVKKRLILSHHKDLNRGDFLIDNRTKNGADHFEGEFIHFGSERFPGWPSVMEHLCLGRENRFRL